MGLVEIGVKMTSSVTVPSQTSRNHPSSSTPTSTLNTTLASSTSPDQVVRKKRTFDIAFLTGQSEDRSPSNSTSVDSAPRGFLERDSPPSNINNNIEEKYNRFLQTGGGGHDHEHLLQRSQSPYNLTQDGTNSDSSSIDVMTNGSLSESESQSHSPSSSIPEQPSPPLHPVVLIHHQQHQLLHPLSRHNGSATGTNGGLGGISQRSSNNSSHDHHQQHHLHHHVDIKSNGGGSGSSPGSANVGKSNKSRNNRSPVKEEIRFESRRTIDINHTVDSLKIKENLQFSTLLPSSATVGLNFSNCRDSALPPGIGPMSSCSTTSPTGSNRTISVTSGADLSLPHLASTIALLPHVARFPLGLPTLPGGGNHMAAAAAAAAAVAAGGNLPFHAKMEKSESINISYPKVRGGMAPFHTDSYAALAASAAAVGGCYPYPNLLGLGGPGPQQGSHPTFPHSPLGSPGSGSNGGASSIRSGPGGQQVSQQPASSVQASQPPPAGLGQSATLLPPSLTSLTLPAQNVCAKCNIGFRMTSDLVYHMRSHHKRDTDPMKKQREEKLKCPVCHETFRERHHLTRHMTAHQARPEET